MSRSTAIGILLLLLTTILVVTGCVVYFAEHVGWAQLLWVMASGTAGGGVVLIIEAEE